MAYAQPSSSTPRCETTGKALAFPLDSGSARIACERRLHLPAGRLVRDDVEHRVTVTRLLHEPGDRDAVGCELVRDAREDAGAILDLEPQVPRRRAARPAGRRSSERHTGSFWRKPVPVVPTIETMSATTADAVSLPPAPGPSSVISRIASPWSMTALNAPVDGGERMVRVDERGADANVDAVADQSGPADQLHVHLHARAQRRRARRVTPRCPRRRPSRAARGCRTRPSRGSPSSPPRRARRRPRSGLPRRTRGAAPRRARRRRSGRTPSRRG